MKLEQLVEEFGVEGILGFRETEGGLIAVEVTAPSASATIYLQGAHVAAWQPTGCAAPVLFTSKRAEFVPGKAIRGGVPISFPWFAARHDGKTGPSHGFARIEEWTLAFAALAGDDLHLTFTLAPTEHSRSLGFDNFRLAFQVIVGRTLTMRLTVANEAAESLVFEEAFHTYFAVADIARTSITGLENTHYLDKMDLGKQKTQDGPIRLTEATDRVYLDTTATCTIHDEANAREIEVSKTNSRTTVVWNPWEAGAKKLADMDDDEWREFVAVETVNAADATVTLPAGAAHIMEAVLSVKDVSR